jgi:hypothetical protein
MLFYLYCFVCVIYANYKLMEGVFENESDEQELCEDTEQKTKRMG